MQHNEKSLVSFLTKIRPKTLTFTALRVNDENYALDILQETMLGFVKVVKKYDETAWTNLFYKILIRRITDFQRKQIWRNRLQKIISFSQLKQDETKNESWDDLHTDEDNTHYNPVESHYATNHLADDFEQAFQALPARQQEAYLLRQWQGMSVKKTADIMGCSQGSVKTHVFRAMKTLKKNLGAWMNEEKI